MPSPLLLCKPPLTQIGDKKHRVSAKPRGHTLLLRHVSPVVRNTSGCSTRCGARVVLCKKRNSLRRKKTQIQGLLLIHQAPKPPAVLQQNYAPGHAHAGPVRQKVLLREIRPRWHPAGALLEHWTVFLRPNGDDFIAFDPLGHPGAAEATMGCPGALQVEKIRPLGSPIATAAIIRGPPFATFAPARPETGCDGLPRSVSP